MNRVLASASVPFRDTALLVNLSFAAVLGGLLWGMGATGVFGLLALPLLIILLPLFVKYCFLVGEQTARGHAELHELVLANLYPFETPPLTLVAVMLVLHLALQAIVGPIVGPIVAAIVVALAAPLAIAVFMGEERVAAAIEPRVLLRYAKALNRTYPLLAVALGVGIYLGSVAVWVGPGALLAVFASQSIFIATFHAIGRLLHEREDAIATAEAEITDERKARILEEGERRDLDKKITQWHRLIEAGKPGRALKGIMAHMAARNHALDLYAELFEHVTAWQEPAIASVFARQYVQRLHQAGQHDRALEVFLRAWNINPTIRPTSEIDTLRIADQARKANRNDVALALVADFEQRFPQSDHLGVALAREAWLLVNHHHDLLNATDLLYRIEHQYPQVFARPDVERLAKRVRGEIGSTEEGS